MSFEWARTYSDGSGDGVNYMYLLSTTLPPLSMSSLHFHRLTIYILTGDKKGKEPIGETAWDGRLLRSPVSRNLVQGIWRS